MSKWIVTQEAHEQLNYKGETLGMCEKNALFYLKQIGKRRTYRRPISETNTDFALQTYTKEKDAKEAADYCNEIHGGNYKPELFYE